jgi:hypothetical protein
MILSGKSSRQDHAEEDGFAKVDTKKPYQKLKQKNLKRLSK